MTSSDTVVEFGRGARMFEISQLLHNVNSLIKERENIRLAEKKISQQQQELIDEEIKY